jgi:putative NADH-flavin reductase
MKILVFGASGRTGKELVAQGLELGHAITAFVRAPSKLQLAATGLTVARGDVVDRAAVEAAVRGHDAVVCALGAPSLLKRDPAVVVGMHNILLAMELEGVGRLSYLSADTVRAARDQLSAVRKLFVPLIFWSSSADHELIEAMITSSRLDWTIVRPPMLTDGERSGAYRSGERIDPRFIIPRVSRADVAAFMLRELTDESLTWSPHSTWIRASGAVATREPAMALSTWRAGEDGR